jgi:hypothetical protein
MEVRLQHSDGSWRNIELMATNLLDNPAVRGVVFNARRHGAQSAEAADSEERFRLPVQTAPTSR